MIWFVSPKLVSQLDKPSDLMFILLLTVKRELFVILQIMWMFYSSDNS